MEPRFEEPAVGQTLGRYRLDRLLGSGATSRVFLATHVQLGRRVAMKLLSPHLLTGRDAVQRVLQEARVVNSVRHPSICEIFDFIEEENPPCVGLVMEYVEGPNLRALDGFRFAFGQAVGMVLQLVAALEATHAAGVIHRDLKPDNVLLTRDPRGEPAARVPRIKLIDFGIAKLAGITGQTVTGKMIGTPAYMAPEQIAGSPPPSPATDVFAVGELLFELLTGARAFPMTTIHEVTRAKLRGQRPDLALPALPGLSSAGSARLLALVERCLERAPGDRPGLGEVKHLLFEIAPFPELRGEQSPISRLPLEPGTRPWLDGIGETQIAPNPVADEAFDQSTLPELAEGTAPPPRAPTPERLDRADRAVRAVRAGGSASVSRGSSSAARNPIAHEDTLPAAEVARRASEQDEAATVMSLGALSDPDPEPAPSMARGASRPRDRAEARAVETAALEALDPANAPRGPRGASLGVAGLPVLTPSSAPAIDTVATPVVSAPPAASPGPPVPLVPLVPPPVTAGPRPPTAVSEPSPAWVGPGSLDPGGRPTSLTGAPSFRGILDPTPVRAPPSIGPSRPTSPSAPPRWVWGMLATVTLALVLSIVWLLLYLRRSS